MGVFLSFIGHPSGNFGKGRSIVKVLGPVTSTFEKYKFFEAHSGVTHEPPAFHPLEATMPMLIFNLFPSAMACLISPTDASPRNAPPAGINVESRIAATSQISALFMPLDFIASRSRVIDVVDMFPFSQHQKAPGLYASVGLWNVFEISCKVELFLSGSFCCRFEQLNMITLKAIMYLVTILEFLNFESLIV